MTTSRFSGPAPPLWKLVAEAVVHIANELEVMVSSFSSDGTVQGINDREAYLEARRYERWLKRARAELLK